MIIDPASVTNGVRTLRRLSLGQQLLTLLVWAGFFGVVFGLVATQPGDGQAFAVPILALLIGAFMLSFAIMRRPRGGEYQMIVSTAGLRGEFGVRRIYPLLATYICIMFAAVSVNGMLSEPPGSRAVAGWALTALAFLLIYAVVLIRLLRVVVAFRIDAEG
ncbi:MAG: hypothetical protein SGI73_04385, partial [Chloroflexota bacterium]|nr:hypothetical protein [Chloroflexota bacterium]